VWAGVDSVWEQEKLEARKMLKNAAESHTSGAPKMKWNSFYPRETLVFAKESILRNGKQASRTEQWRRE
jgi:hypothetical protein